MNVCKGDTQTKTLKRVFADHIQLAFSSIDVFFKKKRKVIMSRFPTVIFWFVFNDWHYSWFTGLWGKKSQRDLGESMLGMLVQCTKVLYGVLTVEALCILSCMTIVFVWTAGKRTSSIAARISVAHKTRGSYKDDRTSDRVDVFSIERGRKRTYKGFQYFCQGHDRESCGTHLFLLDWYFVPHFTLDN